MFHLDVLNTIDYVDWSIAASFYTQLKWTRRTSRITTVTFNTAITTNNLRFR